MTEEILLEKKLTTDFTMGFELEAIWYGESSNFEEYSRDIRNFFSECGLKDGDLHDDGSLRSEGEGATFEWSSPVLPVNLNSINKIINMYKNGLNKKFTVNSSCGLHHHISFPNMSAEDMIWIMCKLSIDTNMRNKISKFKDYNFVSEWSNDEYLNDLAYAVRNDNYNNIIHFCSTEKYSLINVHGQKTLEWRGPRGFLNTNRSTAIKNVTEFYKLFWSFVKWMTDVLDEDEINDVSKDNFMAGIKSAFKRTGLNTLNGFSFEKEKNKDGTLSDTTLKDFEATMIVDKKFLVKIYKQPFFEQVVQWLYNKSKLGKKVDNLNETDTDPEILKKMNSIFYKYIPYRMLVKYFDTLSTDALANTSKLTAKRLFATRRLDGSSVSVNNIAKVLDDKLEYFDEKIFSKEYAEPLYTSSQFYIVNYPNIFKLFANKGWLQELNSDSLESCINNLGTNTDISGEDEIKLKIILSALIEGNKTETLKNISRKILENSVFHPEWVKFIKLNKKQTIWLITKVRDNNPEKLDELKGILINKGEISGPEWNKLEKFTRRATTKISDEDLTYDDDEEDFRNRVNNAQLSGEEELI